MWLVPLLAATAAFGRTVVRDQKLLGEPERAGREAGGHVTDAAGNRLPKSEMKAEGSDAELVNVGDALASLNDKSWQNGRAQTWAGLFNELGFKRGAEVGVWTGEFAKVVLEKGKTLQEYILVDPWKHLADWKKPFNVPDEEFKRIFDTAMANTLHGPYGHKVKVIRALSEDAAKQIADASLDYVYIDGDHTLKGAMKDLQNWAPKVKAGGLVCGDDFEDGMEHGDAYAPTGVKTAVESYARSIGAAVHDLGGYQFAFQMTEPSKIGSTAVWQQAALQAFQAAGWSSS